MTYPPLPFEELNESDVREEVITPLLQDLGYRSGSDNIIREQSLRYPQNFLGRKNPAKDPELRGIADYILEVRRLVRWVLEAKAPSVELGIEEIEQAYTYANHPEVRAVYFVLCNGRQLTVYQTNQGPNAPPVLSVVYERLSAEFGRINDILGPQALLRAVPQQIVDPNPPLGPGLRSVARILGGWISYDYNNYGNNALNEMLITVTYGAIQRDEAGKLVAYLETSAPFRSFQELNERVGLSSFEMESDASELSTNPALPTRFVGKRKIIFPAGIPMLDITQWQKIVLPTNWHCDLTAIANGYLNGHVFTGRFLVRMHVVEQNNFMAEMAGPFAVYVA